MRRSWRVWIGIALITAFGGYLRAATVIETFVDHPIRADAAEYYFSGYNLAKFGVYTKSAARYLDPKAAIAPDSFRVPGLPLIVAALVGAGAGAKEVARDVDWISVALQTAAIALIGAAALAALPAWAALAASLLTAMSPHLIAMVAYMLTENPATFLVALLVAGCALPLADNPRRRALHFAALGLTVGLASLFRPIYFALAPFLALVLAAKGERRRALVPLMAGWVVAVGPWFVRNAISVHSQSATSSLAQTLLLGAYPGYTVAGHPDAYPYPYLADPRAVAASSDAVAALAEVAHRFAADPLGMLFWYVFEKPLYLWQWDTVEGAGGVFIYPLLATPFRTDALFASLYGIMWLLHWPLIAAAIIGSVMVWTSRAAASLSDAGRRVLRAGSLILAYVSVAHFPFGEFPRFFEPQLPLVYLMAMVPLVTAVRMIKRRD